MHIISKELELNYLGPVAKVPVLMGFMRDDGAHSLAVLQQPTFLRL